MAFDFDYPNISAEARGWGPGWKVGQPIGVRPASYPGKIVGLAVDGVSFTGGIREELAELAERLVRESLKCGYIKDLMSPGCWGGAFRPTKRSDGTYTTTPSNHSWYTAVDINAPRNVFGASTHEIPQAMADLWREYGWRWLGPPIKDWMHFDFAGTPSDAARMLEKARKNGIGEEADVTGDELLKGIVAWIQGDPEPEAGPARKAYLALTIAAKKADEVPKHKHPHTHPVPGSVTGAVSEP